jgi:AraC-like DNA-binding protein
MYREWRPDPALRAFLACSWSGGLRRTVRVLPDACVDITWADGRLLVAGPDTGPVMVGLDAFTVVTGVRFRPGVAPAFLGAPASALLDRRVELAELWGRAPAAELADRLAALEAAGAPSTELAATIEAALAGRLSAAAVDPAARGIRAEIRRHRVEDLAPALGYSERQLRRRAAAAFGYGPKTLDRILRFQDFLARAERSAAGDLAGLARAAGYADQAHLTRECGRLSGLSPARLLAERGV